MKALGFALAILGLFALVSGGTATAGIALDVGPFRATATEQTNVPFWPVAGGVLMLGGILVLAIPRKGAA